MSNYQLLHNESNLMPVKVYTDKTFVDLNFNITKATRTDYETNKTYQVFKYDSVRVRNGEPVEEELIRFMIHTEFAIDDEIAFINNKEIKSEEYDAYITRRNELKALAKELFVNFQKSKGSVINE